jgi:biotin synthase-related radical SAM superfamily protein
MTAAPVTLTSSKTRRTGLNESPDWVRISRASAIALRFRSGRFTRDFEFGGMNLLLSYEDGCRSDCGYCGLARTRPGTYEDKSFIRVEWPLVPTDELVDRMAARDDTMTRLCISMVTHPHAYRDTLDIAARITAKVTAPLSILVAPPTLNRTKLERFKTVGVDMIGIGLDAVTEDLFRRIRTDVPAGGAGLS